MSAISPNLGPITSQTGAIPGTNPYTQRLLNCVPDIKRVIIALNNASEPIPSAFRSLCWQEFSKQLGRTFDGDFYQPYLYEVIEEIQKRTLDKFERALVEKVNFPDSFKLFYDKFWEKKEDLEFNVEINKMNDFELASICTVICVLLRTVPFYKSMEDFLTIHLRDHWKVIKEELGKIEICIFSVRTHP